METADRQKIGEELNSLLSDEELGRLQLTTLQYYLHESNPVNGLIRDKTDARAPSSIAAIGLGLATVPVLVERNVISREFAGLAERRGDSTRAAWCRERADTLRVAVEKHAWDGRWYRRAYFDDGTPLGSASTMSARSTRSPNRGP